LKNVLAILPGKFRNSLSREEKVISGFLRAFAVLRQFGMQAAIPAAIILAGHWLRYRRLDWEDFLLAAVVFIAYVAISPRLASRKRGKV
jgi:hypothetical protein